MTVHCSAAEGLVSEFISEGAIGGDVGCETSVACDCGGDGVEGR